MAQIEAACQAGARRAPACMLAGIDGRTYQRWQAGADRRGDGRTLAERPKPAHALSETERAEILAVANEARFAELPPARMVPALADEGRYIASESSFYRVLRAHAPTAAPKPPTTHQATRPRQVWCWDMTYLPAAVRGQWFFLYLILDLYSRKIVGFTVEATDRSDHAAHLLRRTALAEGLHALADKPVLHGDNGATLKATTVLAMLHWLGLKPSSSRPRVSNDNAHAEALFRTAKYRPEFPARGFDTLEEARLWASDFVRWYNTEHLHSGIRYVTPAQRHDGQDHAILAARQQLYQAARNANPARWSGRARNGSPAGCVTLNPDQNPTNPDSSTINKSMPIAA